MESKAAERVQSNAAQTRSKEDAMRTMEHLIRCTPRPAPARVYWAEIKSKVRSFGEYAILRTRQGISMFREPKIESLVKGASAKDA